MDYSTATPAPRTTEAPAALTEANKATVQQEMLLLPWKDAHIARAALNLTHVVHYHDEWYMLVLLWMLTRLIIWAPLDSKHQLSEQQQMHQHKW